MKLENTKKALDMFEKVTRVILKEEPHNLIVRHYLKMIRIARGELKHPWKE